MQPIQAGKTGRPRSLTEDQAREVVRLVDGGHTRTSIAKHFGVNRKVIQNILSGVHYGDVTGIEYEAKDETK